MQAERLNAAFAALADPTRRAILARLAKREMTVTELAKPFAISGPGLSKHLRVLERAGMIDRGREAQWRPCRLRPQGLKIVDSWLEEYRRYWDASFERLDEYLAEAQRPTTRRSKSNARRK